MVVVQRGIRSESASTGPSSPLDSVQAEGPEMQEQRDSAPEVKAAVVGGVAAGRAGWWRAPKGSYWFTGRVELPQGVPGDETLWVTAQGSRFSENPDSRDTHTVIAEPDGSFRVAFSGRTHSKGRLWVRGRYCYMDGPLWVQMKAADEEVVLKPKLGGRLLVKVLPPRTLMMGEDVLAGLTVEAIRGSFPNRRVLDAWPREEGSFEIGGVEPKRSHTVRAHSALYADGLQKGVTVEAGQTHNVDVALSLGATIAGTVSDEQGNLIEGARVFHISKEQAEDRIPFISATPEFETLTHAGQFRLPGVPPGDRVLIVEADGYLEYEQALDGVRDGGERLALAVRLNAGRSVSGVVLWQDGAVAVGADVRISQRDDLFGMDVGRIKGEVRTGPDGSFTFSALGEGPCEVTASSLHPDDRPDPGSKLSRLKAKRIPLWMDRVEDVAPGPQIVTLTLSSGRVLSGKVVDDQGEPVKNFKVIASPATDNVFSAGSMKTVRGKFKDEGGEFTLQGLQVGRWMVRVTATGYGDSERKDARIPGKDELNFALLRTGSASGIVRAPDGVGVDGARIVIKHGENRTAAVDANGKGEFLAANLAPGWVEVTATADGFAGSEMQKFQINAASQRDNLVLTLRPGATIHVELHEGVADRVGRRISLGGPSSAQRETDREGTAIFEGLDAGTYEVTLNSGSGRSRGDWVMRFANAKKAKVEVAEGEAAFVVLGAPSPTAVTVTGSVRRGEEGLGGALVMVEQREVPDGAEPGRAAVRANDLGEYSIVLDGPGLWAFSVGSSQRELVTFLEDVVAGADVEINFDLPESGIEGRVRGPGGNLLDGVRVTLTAGTGVKAPEGFTGRTKTTNEAGEFSFTELPLGSYTLRAGGAATFSFNNQEPKYGVVFVELELEVPDLMVSQDFSLPVSGKITGTVMGSEWVPVSGARITVVDDAGHTLFSRVRTGTDGSFTYDGLGAGSFTVWASGDGGTSEKRTVKLFEGGEASVQLTLKE